MSLDPSRPIATLQSVPEIPADLAEMSTPDLRAELSRSLELTARQLVRLAAIVRVLEERGEDLFDLRLGLLNYLRRIAHGQLAPELVVRYAASPLLLRYAGMLPMPDQVRLASGEPVPVVSRGDGGRTDVRLVDAKLLSAAQIRQVMGPDGLRGQPEQAAYLEQRLEPPKTVAGAKAIRRGRVKADRRKGGLRVGRSFAPLGDVLEAIEDLKGGDPKPDEPMSRTVTVKLTEAEHLALRRMATEADAEMSHLARRALLLSGLIRPRDEEA